ncbi:MAG: hypothetical protein IPH17_01525 [Bacteroidales bacterium]|nr:hypothetical protein [Bacteroidales bacterium]
MSRLSEQSHSKNGFQGGQQMYICRKCGRHFRVTTGTFVYRIQKKEKMLDYIRCMLEAKLSEFVLRSGHQLTYKLRLAS